MDELIRFSTLVRQGLRFRRKFEIAKRMVEPRDFQWYPYDCYSNLFYIQKLLNDARFSFAEIAGEDPVLDLGAADGALSFFLESIGYRVDAFDYSGANMNRMQGIRTLATGFGSGVQIHDVNIDAQFNLEDHYGVALFLGTLYHLKNPFYALEKLAQHTRFCFLSTRVARWNPDKSVRLDQMPVGYLLDADECNGDATNYWVFSPPGLMLLVRRAGWNVFCSATSGASESDPVSQDGDERMFLLLRSKFT